MIFAVGDRVRKPEDGARHCGGAPMGSEGVVLRLGPSNQLVVQFDDAVEHCCLEELDLIPADEPEFGPPLSAKTEDGSAFQFREDVMTKIAALTKPTNPKDAFAVAKAYASTVPRPVMWEVGLAMLEGSLKYGRHNYRDAGVLASVYYNACQRHLDQWWEGEDIDPDSLLSHITKLIASAVVLRDAMMNNKWTDDRPPRPVNANWMTDMNAAAKVLLDKYPEEVRKAAFTQREHGPTIPNSED